MPLGRQFNRTWAIYIDNFGNAYKIETLAYLAEAGGLETYDREKHGDLPQNHRKRLQERHLKVTSVKPSEHTGKYEYANLVVLAENPLWTGEIGQRLIVGVTVTFLDKCQVFIHNKCQVQPCFLG